MRRSNDSSTSSAYQRLAFLSRVARKEAALLETTSNRLFSGTNRVDVKDIERWVQDSLLAERMDAFVARFGRLQDTLGDKLIPTLLRYLGESTGPAMDNLDKAERFGWIGSASEWMVYRKLRNQMVHDYIEDPVVLADAFNAGNQFVPSLIEATDRLVQEVERRLA